MIIHSIIFALAAAAGIMTDAPAGTHSNKEEVWIRVNQAGYLPGDSKIAVLSSGQPLSGTFEVGAVSSGIGADCGAWGPFQHNYRLNFSSLKEPGEYRIRFGEIQSPAFQIGDGAYQDVLPKLREFMKLQRCGDNPITGEKCHQQDGVDVVTGERLDLTGGWHDAADRLKHMITTTYCTAALFLADEEEEARHGAALLKKIHPAPGVIYVQIGDDRDHLPPMTLWHDDQSDYGWGPGGPRAAWRATGKPEGPTYKNESDGLANLAGRCSAALMLAGDREAAESLYRLACANPGCAMSVPVRAPYYYGESTYFDDLEWAAAELYIATRETRYLREAVDYARRAAESRWMGKDRHGHYEFFPYVNLAHWRLYPHVDEAMKDELAAFYRIGLERIRERAIQNPYRLGTPLVWCSTNNVIAFALQARLYQKMTGDNRYESLAAEARDWIFGRNPWGVSFVIGVPEHGVYASRPHHLFYHIKNHLPVGGLVDGPVYKEINDNLKYDSFGEDALARFQSDIGVYHDCFGDFSTNEPIIDGTVSLILLLNEWP
ncbi:MAG: glycoside hydrolase family 9 protein [Candidatus Omnitrophica bacterium]|nr:glycoside hydrolase family 9 protein [Candidatus Omnitrophota bacterium]